MNPKSDPSASTPGKPALHLGTFASPGVPEGSDPEGATIIIKRAAAETVARSEDTPTPVDTDSNLPPSVMLGLIAYCYERGIFRSDDIAQRIAEQPDLAEAFGDNLPDGPAIRRFRRRHADAIEDTLETLYRRLPTAPEADTVHIQRQAKDRVHDAAWKDNTSR